MRLLPECTAILTLLILLWSAIGLELYQQRSSALTDAAQHATNLAKIFEETTTRITTGIDYILLDLRDDFVLSDGDVDLSLWQAQHHRAHEFDGHIGITNAEGRLLASSQAGASINLAEREYFKMQLDQPADELYISRPLVGRDTGKSVVVFSRKRFDRNGQFNGIVFVALYSQLLSKAFRVDDFAGGSVGLVGEDGIIRAHYPPEKIGEDISATLAMAKVPEHDINRFLLRRGPDGAVRILSVRRVNGTKMVVEVGFVIREVLAKFYVWSAITVAAGLLATLVVAGLGKLWLTQRKGTLRSQTALTETLRTISQGIAMVDRDGRLSVVNDRAMALLNAGDNTLDGRESAKPGLSLMSQITSGSDISATGAPDVQELLSPQGGVIEIRRHPIETGGTVFTFTDITAHKEAEAKMTRLAMRDPQTGLANRQQLHRDVARVAEECVHSERKFSLLQLNVDDFKLVNNSYGYDYADNLLKTVGEELVALSGADDVVARLGSDEFAILHVGADQEATEWLAQRIQDRFKARSTETEHIAMLRFSIGIACFPSDGTEPATLLKKAGIALSRAKADGQGQIRFFTPEMERSLFVRRTLQSDLRDAIANDEIKIAFQPQFCANTLQVVGFEALARWTHPMLGAISPDLFIRIAEESGMIEALGDQMMHRACRIAATWSQPLRIGVNLSPLQFRSEHLPNQVEAVLWETGLAAHRLELEVTEGVLIGEQKSAQAILSVLTALGVRLALDDFGTGYSSLSYLRNFHFDTLKIDKSFVQSLAESDGSRAILEAILRMAQRLYLDVIAEGVETEAQMEILKNEGCQELQGYLLGRPMPPEAVPALIEARWAKPSSPLIAL
jgi:diguanylate cyclase (GGDEF)-like protein